VQGAAPRCVVQGLLDRDVAAFKANQPYAEAG
jgi:hypothetical protein